MPTASLAGKNGNVTGVTGVTEIREWSVTLAVDVLDATSMASAGWREFILGLQGATGSLTAVGLTMPATGTIVALVLQSGTTGAPQISGAAILGSVEASTPHDGVVEYSSDFTFNGVVTVGVVS